MKKRGVGSGKRPVKKVFVDANTIVSGLLFGGNESVLLRLGMIRLGELVTSEYVVEEVKRVLCSRFDLSEDDVAFLTSYLHRCIRVYPPPSSEEIDRNLGRLKDKKDVHVLVAFEKLGCDLLVTGDSELLSRVKRAKRTRQVLEQLLMMAPHGKSYGR